MNNKIWLSSPHMSEEKYEEKFVKNAFDTNWIAPLGENVNKFETELCDYVKIDNALATVSGTSAIHLALLAAGVKDNDIVFCQSLTFSATANPIVYERANPVFIDSDFETWNMDPNLLEEAFKKYPNPKAVVVVHLYGLPANIEKIREICIKHNTTLIEDAAESLGSKINNKHTGTFGDYGIFSFNGNKIITTSGGGMLVSNKKGMIDKCRFWATQSRDNARHYQHSEIGFNYRLSNVCAGIGRGQLLILNNRIEQKKFIYNYYKRELSNLNGITFMPLFEDSDPNYWLSCIILTGDVRPADVMFELDKENIESRPIWKPMHLQPIFSKYDKIISNKKVSQYLFENGLCLPSDTKLSEENLSRICEVIKRAWAK